jgi:hypothetical protein
MMKIMFDRDIEFPLNQEFQNRSVLCPLAQLTAVGRVITPDRHAIKSVVEMVYVNSKLIGRRGAMRQILADQRARGTADLISLVEHDLFGKAVSAFRIMLQPLIRYTSYRSTAARRGGARPGPSTGGR